MKITKRDIEKINRDVHDIIHDWLHRLTVYNIKPKTEQPDWNSIMSEVNGNVEYDVITGVPCSLFDTSFVDENIQLGGYVDTGKCRVCIPYSYKDASGNKVTCDNIIKYETQVEFEDMPGRWNVSKVKRIQGEIFLTLEKVV